MSPRSGVEQAPVERHPEIVVHELKPIEPANLIRAYQPGLRVPGQRHEEFEVPFAYLRRLFTPQQTVPAVLPDRFEKADTVGHRSCRRRAAARR